jgi:hypothetical protein
MKRLFGLDRNFTASELLLVRDAQDRVAKLASSQDAASRLAAARVIGDDVLERAIAERALNEGWRDISNDYADRAPADALAVLRELDTLRTPPNINT